MDFNKFKKEWQSSAMSLLNNARYVFQADVTGQQLWDTYINAFPEAYRQENTCNACRSFIKQYGGMAFIDKDNFSIKTIWEGPVSDPAWQAIIRAMKALVVNAPIKNVMEVPRKLGTNYNFGASLEKWEHLYLEVPNGVTRVYQNIHERRTTKDLLEKGLKEIKVEAIKDVLSLINENSLYRGAEEKRALESFLEVMGEYQALQPKQQEGFLWLKSVTLPESVSRLRNNLIGNLLLNLSNGDDPEAAVKQFENAKGGANYRRPNAVVTSSSLASLEKQLREAGMLESLKRRQALATDISVEHCLFTNRNKAKGSVFEELEQDIQVDVRKLKAKETSLEDFLKLLPMSSSAQLLLEGRMQSNLMALITAEDPEARPMFSWDNLISWSYAGGVADSIVERVKKAGGKIVGRARASLAWETTTDLDLHLFEPDGTHVYYARSQRKSKHTGAELDVDQNAGGGHTRTPVENIIFPLKSKLTPGRYEIKIHNYYNREATDSFTVEVEIEGVLHTFHHNKQIRDGDWVTVTSFTYDDKTDTIKIDGNPSSTSASSTLWGLKTNRFQNIELAMFSPNHWESEVGNKHLFMILEGCKAEGELRGFLNEFLKPELNPHRRALEALGSKLLVSPNKDGLAGVGFSLTQKGSHFYCKLNKQIYKVTI